MNRYTTDIEDILDPYHPKFLTIGSDNHEDPNQLVHTY